MMYNYNEILQYLMDTSNMITLQHYQVCTVLADLACQDMSIRYRGVGRCLTLWGHNILIARVAREKNWTTPTFRKNHTHFASARLKFGPGIGKPEFLGCSNEETSCKLSRVYSGAVYIHGMNHSQA